MQLLKHFCVCFSRTKMTTVSGAYQVGALLEKMNSLDKDFRFMAVSDLMREVSNGMKMDDDSERKVVRGLLKLLNDKNGEVQNLAVKCLGTLAPRVKEAQAEVLADSLSASMVGGADEERDVSSVALKAVVTSLTAGYPCHSANIARRLLPKMIVALSETKPTDSVRLEILDIVADVLLRFGTDMTKHHDETQKVLLVQLKSERQALRKRATVALGHLTSSCSSDLFRKTVQSLLDGLNTAKSTVVVRTYVIALTYVAKSSGSRFAEHLATVIPLLLLHLEKTEDDESGEALLQAFEAFFYVCPREVAAFQAQIQKALIEKLSYDPNYSYDGDDEDESMEVEDDEYDDEDAENFSDDDDMSWKVRRAAAKSVEAMIFSRRTELLTSITVLGPLLISRLREREESVRTDIFAAYVAILKQAHQVVPHPLNALAKDSETQPPVVIGLTHFSAGILSVDQLRILSAIHEQCDSLIKAVTRQLKNKSVKTRLSCFELLSELVRVLPNALSGNLPLVMPGVALSLNDKAGGAQMKVDGLMFVSHSIRTHLPSIFQPHLAEVVQLVVGAIRDSFYKVSSEGLYVAAQLVPVLKSCNDESLVTSLYEAVNEKLKCTDIDQDVKERAIAAAGSFIALFGDVLAAEVPACLSLLLDRVNNEMTRLAAVRALSQTASGDFPAVLCDVIDRLLPILADFLKKNHRALKTATLNLVEVLLVNDVITGLDSDGLTLVVGEIPNLIKDSDLQITQLALKCLTLVMVRYPARVTSHLPTILQSITVLLQSALLQGSTLVATIEVIRTLVINKIPGKPSFEALLDQITAPIYDEAQLPRQAFHSISSATAAVAAANGDLNQASSLVTKLTDQLNNSACGDNIRLFCLQSIGELGRRFPQVYDKSGTAPAQLLVAAFNSAQEDLKTAAAQALGALAVGNLTRFLPFILQQIETQPKKQYLLLHSLKEVISWESVDSESIEVFRQKIAEIWPVLISHSKCAEEGTRNVVAECLGKLCVADPKNLLPKLKEHVKSPSSHVRSCVVTAVKFMVGGERKAVDVELQTCISDFLGTIADPDLEVRRVALVVLNSAAHNKPVLIRDLLPTLLPAVYEETKVRRELIREVEMGPFKHQVDDGLDLRKAAFECMYTLLESCLEKLDIFEFINHMEDGLKDHHHDIRLLTFLMLIRLTSLCPGQVLQKLDRICEQIKTQLGVKPKANAVKQEMEKLDELKRAAIRVVLTLQKIPDAERQQQLVDVLNLLRNNAELNTLAEQVKKDTQRAFVGDVPMDTI